MGYFIYKIADETKTPAKVSLSDNPNFIQFESEPSTNEPVEISIDVLRVGYHLDDSDPNNMKFINVTKFTIVEKKTNIEHPLKGTSDISDIDRDTFYLGPLLDLPIEGWPAWQNYQTAESLKNALQQNDFIGNNFDITLPPKENPDGSITRGNIIKLKSKGSGDNYAFKIIADDARLYDDFFTVTGNPENTTNGDSISEGYNPVEIQLDIYQDTGVFLGENDKPNNDNLGTYVKTLSKAYSYNPIWFNVNILDANIHSTDFLNSTGWIDTGTIKDFRFTAKRFTADSEKYEIATFYYSNVLYMLTCYKRNLELNDLS